MPNASSPGNHHRQRHQLGQQRGVSHHHRPATTLLSMPAEKARPRESHSGPVLPDSDGECTDILNQRLLRQHHSFSAKVFVCLNSTVARVRTECISVTEDSVSESVRPCVCVFGYV